MIPILYDKNETVFESNGLGRLRDCIRCVVTEERNGIYECDFEYPIGGAHYEDIQVGRIIGASHDDATFTKAVRKLVPLTDEETDILTDENNVSLIGDTDKLIPEYDIQPFDIVSYTKPINGVVTFHCVHISYRLSYIATELYSSMGINSLANALYYIKLMSMPSDNPFSFWTDKVSTGYLGCVDGIPHSIRSTLGGAEGSILDAYGGEYEWDKFTVKLWESRGQKRDFSIRYGVNMLNYDEEFDIQGTFSSCVPYWTDGTSHKSAPMVRSNGSTITGRGECVPLDLSDKFEEMPDEYDLQDAAAAYMTANNTFLPKQTIKVEFVRLQDLDDGYSDYENLLECNLCDTINVIFPDYNGSAEYKIVKTVWDVLRDRYESMELGELSATLSEALGIDSGNNSAQSVWDSDDGYCKMPDGTLIQWSTTSIDSLTTAVAMPKEFLTVNDYQVMVTLINNSNNATNVTAIVKTGRSTFSLGVNTVPSGGAHWVAIGRWR